MNRNKLMLGDEVYYCQPGKEKLKCTIYELKVDEAHVEVQGSYILLLVPYEELEPIPLTKEYLARVSNQEQCNTIWHFSDFYVELDENGDFLVETDDDLIMFKSIKYRHELNHFIQEFNNEDSRS